VADHDHHTPSATAYGLEVAENHDRVALGGSAATYKPPRAWALAYPLGLHHSHVTPHTAPPALVAAHDWRIAALDGGAGAYSVDPRVALGRTVLRLDGAPAPYYPDATTARRIPAPFRRADLPGSSQPFQPSADYAFGEPTTPDSGAPQVDHDHWQQGAPPQALAVDHNHDNAPRRSMLSGSSAGFSPRRYRAELPHQPIPTAALSGDSVPYYLDAWTARRIGQPWRASRLGASAAPYYTDGRTARLPQTLEHVWREATLAGSGAIHWPGFKRARLGTDVGAAPPNFVERAPEVLSSRSVPFNQAKLRRHPARLAFSPIPHKDATALAPWSQAAALDRPVGAVMDALSALDELAALPYRQATPGPDDGAVVPFGDQRVVDQFRAVPYRQASPGPDVGDVAAYRQPPRNDAERDSLHRGVRLGGIQDATRLSPIYAPEIGNDLRAALRPIPLSGSTCAYRRPPGVDVRLAAPAAPSGVPVVSHEWTRRPSTDRAVSVPVQMPTLVPWSGGITRDRSSTLPWGPGQPVDDGPDIPFRDDDPQRPGDYPDIIPPRGTYTVDNTISVIRKSDSAPILASAVQASIDMDSVAHSVSLVVHRENDLAIVDPSTGLGPREVTITVNGWSMVALIERYRRVEAFGRPAWQLQGRGRSAALLAPYAHAATGISSGLAAASQLATDALAGTGWTLAWDAVDWNIGAGEYSYREASPLDRVSRIAATIGALVEPDTLTRTLTVRPRFAVNPSGWLGSTPSAVIPAGVITQLETSYEPGIARNAVYVTGGTQGVNVNATRQGTAGDNPLENITDDLVTTLEAGAERARIAIYGSGPRSDVTLELPMMDPPGYPQPGDIVHVTQSSTWAGLVRGTAISAVTDRQGRTRAGQRLTIDRRA